MPIYEYQCECGAVLESLESLGTVRERCGELCACIPDAKEPPGTGRVSKLMSAAGIRGDGREAREPVFSPSSASSGPAAKTATAR